MLQFVWEVKGWLAENNVFDKRWLNKQIKSALATLGWYWHKNIMPIHFTRAAYGRYWGAIGHRKKMGQPLVETGALRDRLKQHSGVQVTSTANKVTVRMPFGNPGLKDKKALDREAAVIAKTKGIKFSTARRMVSRSNAYNERSKVIFRQNLTALSKKEERELAQGLAKQLKRDIDVHVMSKKSRRKTIKSGGAS